MSMKDLPISEEKGKGRKELGRGEGGIGRKRRERKSHYNNRLIETLHATTCGMSLKINFTETPLSPPNK